MVATVPRRGTLVTLLGRNHARLGMEPMHRECREYMEGYKEYSSTAESKPIKLSSQPRREQ